VFNFLGAVLCSAAPLAVCVEVLTGHRIAAVVTAIGSVALLVGVSELRARSWGRMRSDAIAELLEARERG
jgi:hypothetical protein